MSVQFEKHMQRAEAVSKRAGVASVSSAIATSLKRVGLALWILVVRVILTPSPKAAARHGMEMWASAEHVSRHEAHYYESSRGGYR